MDEPQIAPVETPEQQQPVGAPPPEQAQPDQAAEQQLATIDPRFFAAYTQGQQKLAAVASALGISKTSTAEQFVAAITARQQAAIAEEDELAKDPRYAQRIAALRQHEERLAQERFGDAAAIAATLLEQGPRMSLMELSTLVDQALTDKAAARFAGASPAPAGGTPQPQQQEASQGGVRERGLIGEMQRTGAGGTPTAQPPRADSPVGFFENLFRRPSAP